MAKKVTYYLSMIYPENTNDREFTGTFSEVYQEAGRICKIQPEILGALIWSTNKTMMTIKRETLLKYHVEPASSKIP